MIRLNLVKGLGPVLQIAEGWTLFELPEEVSDKLWKRTDYTWPCTWFTPRCDGKEGAFKTAYDVMNNWGANHGAISYGHIGADLITMCSMLRIPVSMTTDEAGMVWVYAQLHGMFGFLEENYLKPATLAEGSGIRKSLPYTEARMRITVLQ